MLKSWDTAVWSVPTAQFTLHMRYNMTTCCSSQHPPTGRDSFNAQDRPEALHRQKRGRKQDWNCRKKSLVINVSKKKNNYHAEQCFHFRLCRKNSVRCQEVIWTNLPLLWYLFWMPSLHMTDLQVFNIHRRRRRLRELHFRLLKWHAVSTLSSPKNHIIEAWWICFSIHRV